MKKLIITVLAAVLVSPAFCNAEEADVEAGKKTYNRFCVKCHSEDGGGSDYGMKLRPKQARDLRTNRLFLSDTELLIVINHGAYGREMPNWEYVLSEEETKNVAQYVRTFDYAPDPKNGERLFDAKCALCHAPEGPAKKIWKAPDLEKSALSPFETARLIRFGIHSTLMYPREGLHTNTEIADVVEYIEGLRK